MIRKHFGSCLCGTVRFEVEGNLEKFYLCHCEHCRKDTGSAHAASLFSSVASLRWVSGEDKTTLFTLPSTRHSKCFCSVCGSALPTLQMEGQVLVVPAGSLNSEVPLRPDAHLFCSSRANWDERLEEIPMLERHPFEGRPRVVDDNELSGNLLCMMKAAGRNAPQSKPIPEINPDHPLGQRLKHGDGKFGGCANLLLDRATLAKGSAPAYPAGFVQARNRTLQATASV